MSVGIASPPETWDIETGVVIVGGGACGLVAGLRATAAGAEALVLEREPRLSGSRCSTASITCLVLTRP